MREMTAREKPLEPGVYSYACLAKLTTPFLMKAPQRPVLQALERGFKSPGLRSRYFCRLLRLLRWDRWKGALLA